MKQKTFYTEKQPNVRYQEISESKADVIVNEFIGEEIMIVDPEKNIKQTMFAYWTNIFSVNPTKITENDIKMNFKKYMDYTPTNNVSFEELQTDFNIDVDYRVSMLELGLV